MFELRNEVQAVALHLMGEKHLAKHLGCITQHGTECSNLADSYRRTVWH